MAATGALIPIQSVAQDDPDSRVGDTAKTIAECRAGDDSQCKFIIGFAVVTGLAGKCAPREMEAPNDLQVQIVLSWLEQHPQVEPNDFAAASNVALDTLYPCPK
jgi:hypothetical protein